MMNTVRKLFDFIVCGYSEKNRASHHWQGFNMGDNRRGRAFNTLLEFRFWIKYRATLDFKLWLADLLSRKAMRLRDEKTSVFGFYDSFKGNRAAKLCDDLDTSFLLNVPTEQWIGSLESFRADLQELGCLAGATCSDNGRDSKRSLGSCFGFATNATA